MLCKTATTNNWWKSITKWESMDWNLEILINTVLFCSDIKIPGLQNLLWRYPCQKAILLSFCEIRKNFYRYYWVSQKLINQGIMIIEKCHDEANSAFNQLFLLECLNSSKMPSAMAYCRTKVLKKSFRQDKNFLYHDSQFYGYSKVYACK